jgi:O-antigen/teichoic acid export membrane protein
MIKKLFLHTLIYGITPQVSKIASIFALPIITTHLTELDFGIFGLITAIVGSLEVFNTLGLNVVLSNSFFKNPGQYKWAWRQIYGFLILWNIPYAFILATILYFFIPAEAAHNTWIIILLNVVPVVFFGPTSVLGAMYYQLKQKPLQIGIRGAIIGLITVALNIYFIAGLKWGYLGWFFAICISQMLYHISYFIPLIRKIKIRPIFNFKWRFIRHQIKISLPTIPHYYGAYLLDTSDRVVMKIVNISTVNIGLYNVANTVGNFVQSGGSAASQAIGPMLLQSYKNRQEVEARKLIFVLQTFFLCVTSILSIWMKEIFVLLINNKELQAVYPLAIIITMATNYRPMYIGANARLFYIEKTKVLLKVSFTAGVLNVLVNITLMPIYGYQVAAYTTFACLMYMGYSGYFLKEYRDNCVLRYYPFVWLLSTMLLTAISLFLVEEDNLLRISMSCFFVITSGMLIRKFAIMKDLQSTENR